MAIGKLFVVSTPIGSLADITYRAVEVLRSVDLIAAEDTRHSRVLLEHYNISTPLTSYHDFNKEEKSAVLAERMKQGQQVALVSDAGTPGIADPGYYLINRCIQNHIPVVPVPGPSAFLAALSVSGLPTDAFVFDGYLPRKAMARRRRLESLKDETRTLIFYESPHRLLKSLEEIAVTLGDRRIVVAREITKKFEELARGRIQSVLEVFRQTRPRGEFTLVVEGEREGPGFW